MPVELIHADERLVDVRLLGPICNSGVRDLDSIHLQSVCDALSARAGRVLLRINSPGGSMGEAFAIYSYLRALGRPITTRVEVRASSAAVFVAMAGDQVEVEDGARLLIHSSFMFVPPDFLRDAVRKVFELNVAAARILADRTGRSMVDELERLQAGERTLDSMAAVRDGYADRVVVAATRGT